MPLALELNLVEADPAVVVAVVAGRVPLVVGLEMAAAKLELSLFL